jgi:hypothetical protein
LVAMLGGCPPFAGAIYTVWDGCQHHNEGTLDVLKTQSIEDVILIGRWTSYTDRTDYLRYNQSDEIAMPTYSNRALSLEDTRAVFGKALKQTVETLRRMGKRVTIVGPVPEIGLDVPTNLAMRRMRGLPEDFGPTRAQFETRNKTALDDLASLDRTVRRIYPHLTLCTAARCDVARDGKPLYFDDNHLDDFGAETIRPLLDPIFADHH